MNDTNNIKISFPAIFNNQLKRFSDLNYVISIKGKPFDYFPVIVENSSYPEDTSKSPDVAAAFASLTGKHPDDYYYRRQHDGPRDVSGQSGDLAELIVMIRAVYGNGNLYGNTLCTGSISEGVESFKIGEQVLFNAKLISFICDVDYRIFICPNYNVTDKWKDYFNNNDVNYIVSGRNVNISPSSCKLVIGVDEGKDNLFNLITFLFNRCDKTADAVCEKAEEVTYPNNNVYNNDMSRKWRQFIVTGSSYNLINGIASTKSSLNGCDPSWFPPGDGTVILGAGAIDSTRFESRTSATWQIQIDSDSVKHFQKGYLVIACQRLFGGLHSAKRGARAEIKLNDDYVDGFSLLVIPSGHSDYFHRIPKPSLPEPFSQWGTVYTWPIQKNALSTEGCQTVSVSIDKEASWDIDSVGIICISESNKRRYLLLVAITLFILSLLSLGIFYLKRDNIIVNSHLESIYKSGANFYVDVTNNSLHDIYIKSVMLDFDLKKAPISYAGNDSSKTFKIDGESHQLSCEDSNIDKEPLRPGQQRQYRTGFTIDQIGRYLKEGFSKPTVNVYSNRSLLASTQSPLLGKELMMHYSSEAKLLRLASPPAATTVIYSNKSDTITKNANNKKQKHYDVKENKLNNKVTVKPSTVSNYSVEIEAEPKWVNTK